jgi:hypothetical protein
MTAASEMVVYELWARRLFATFTRLNLQNLRRPGLLSSDIHHQDAIISTYEFPGLFATYNSPEKFTSAQ